MSGRDVRREEAPSIRIRCGDRGEANDKLGGVGRFSWSVEPKEETFRAAEISLDTRPLIYSSVRGWLSPCTFNRNVLVLTSSPEWVSKLPGMLGPL